MSKAARGIWNEIKGKKLPPGTAGARSAISAAKSALPSICNQLGSEGADVRYYAGRVGADCPRCLGDGKCVSQRQIDKCKRHARTMDSKLSRFNRQYKKFQKHAKALGAAVKKLTR